MYKLLKISILTIFLMSGYLQAAGNYIYAIVSPTQLMDSSYVIQFKIENKDSLVQLKSWPTGGIARSSTANSRIITDEPGKFLYITNVESDDISVFQILENGILSPVEGSPFKTQYASPFYLALHPSNKFLYTTHKSGLCWFDVAENGALSLKDSLYYPTIDSIPYYFNPRQMQISPDGVYLYMIDMMVGVRAYHIDSENGSLTELPGSPFSYTPLKRASKLYFSKGSDSLFVFDLDEGIFAFSINQDGSLEQISESALVSIQELSPVATFSTDYRYMFYGTKGRIYAFTSAGEPFMQFVSQVGLGYSNIYWISQIINYAPANVIYSFSKNKIFQHGYDNSGKFTIIREPLIVNTDESYELDGAVLIENIATGIQSDNKNNMVNHFALEQNYPNPFNPNTIISYQLSDVSRVELSIYNVIGQKVATLISEQQQAGRHRVTWNAGGFPSGVYFYKLQTDKGQMQSKKLLLIK